MNKLIHCILAQTSDAIYIESAWTSSKKADAHYERLQKSVEGKSFIECGVLYYQTSTFISTVLEKHDSEGNDG